MFKLDSAITLLGSSRGSILVAEETGVTKRKFHVMQLDEFLRRDLCRSSFHECIHPDEPVKMFMDVDEKNSEGRTPTHAEATAVVQGIQPEVTSAMMEVYGREVDAPMVFTACRAGHLSLHITWDVWFKTPGDLFRFLESVFDSVPYGRLIDRAVYPRNNKCKWLRFPYTNKFTEEGRIHAQLVPLDGPPEFNVERMLKGCITINARMTSALTLANAFPLLELETVENVREEDEPVLDHFRPNMLIAWMQQSLPDMNADTIRAHASGKFSFATNMFCPRAGRVHEKNRTYVNCSPRGQLHAYCTDGDCGEIRFFPYSMLQVEVSHVPLVLPTRGKRVKH